MFCTADYTLVVITFACSTIMLHFGVFVEDLLNVITIVLQLGFYISGIFYSIENKLDGILGELLIKCNPIALIICDLRRVLIYNQDPHWVALLAWFVVGIVISVIGIRTIYKHENSYVKVI